MHLFEQLVSCHYLFGTSTYEPATALGLNVHIHNEARRFTSGVRSQQNLIHFFNPHSRGFTRALDSTDIYD
jgi:hypothetical protein